MNCTADSEKSSILHLQSVNAEAMEIDVERVLHDVMHIIVSHLAFKDLTSVSKVCKSWRHEALREKGKRFYIQQFNLPYDEVENLDDILTLNPCSSLLFYEEQKYYNQALIESMGEQSHNLIAMHFDQCLTTDEVKFKIEKEQYYNVWSIFSPNLTGRVRVRVACTSSDAVNRYVEIGRELTESLGLKEGEHRKSTLLLFINVGNPSGAHRLFANEVIRRFESNSSPIILLGPTSIWTNYLNEDNKRVVSGQCVAAVNIIGESVDTWITMIHCSSTIDDIGTKLRELNERVKPRRHCIGFFSGYICDEIKCNHKAHPAGNSRMVMRMLRCCIPSVPFFGTFRKRRGWPEVGTDVFGNEMLNRLRRDMTVAIISYD